MDIAVILQTARMRVHPDSRRGFLTSRATSSISRS